MSLTSVLKNIYSFVEVLQASSTDAVGSWDKASLQNALQWATYCEQVYQKSKGKPYEDELNRQICHLGKLPMALGSNTLCLGFLENCKQKLTMALIQNPHISDELFDELVSSNMSENTDAFLEDCFLLSKAKASLQLALAMRAEITHTKLLADTIPPDVAVRAEASLLHDHMKKVFSDCHSRESAEKYCSEKLVSILKEPNGMVILLHCLLADKGDEQPALHFLLQFIVKHIEDCLSGSESLESLSLHDVCPKLLSTVAASYHSFFQVYMKYLSHCINTLKDLSKAGKSLDEESTYSSVISRIRPLMDSEPFIVAQVKNWLIDNERIASQHPNIWTKVLQECIRD